MFDRVKDLFKDAPELLLEFKDFLPETVPPAQPGGLVGILPQPITGPGVPGTFPLPEPSSVEKGAKQPSRRRKRPEKEPVAPQKPAGRVSRLPQQALGRLSHMPVI